MNYRRAFGWLLLATPLAGIFAYGCWRLGWFVTLGIFAAAFAIIGCLLVGVEMVAKRD